MLQILLLFPKDNELSIGILETNLPIKKVEKLSLINTSCRPTTGMRYLT